MSDDMPLSACWRCGSRNCSDDCGDDEADEGPLDPHPCDICECGDRRRDHEDDGAGRCRMPDDLTHGFEPCLKFKFSGAASKEDRRGEQGS